MTDRKRMERAFVDAVRRYRTPVVVALGVARDEEASTTLAVHCAEATGRYRLQAARMLAALLPDDVLARSVEAAEAQERGVLEYAGPRESPAQGKCGPLFRGIGSNIVGFPTGGEGSAL